MSLLCVFARRARSASSSFIRSSAAFVRSTRSRAARCRAARCRAVLAAGSLSSSAFNAATAVYQGNLADESLQYTGKLPQKLLNQYPNHDRCSMDLRQALLLLAWVILRLKSKS